MTELVVPLTGEIVSIPSVDLTASDTQLISVLQSCQNFKDSVDSQWRNPIEEELLRRMDKRANWTIHSADHTARGRSPAPAQEWDIEKLQCVLLALLDEGVIDTYAANEALNRVVSYKPRASGINAIRKLSPEIAQRIDECAIEGPQRVRRVSVRPRIMS